MSARAFELLVDAGENALRRGDADSADRLFTQALDLGLEDRRGVALFGRGRGLIAASRLVEADAALREAQQLADAAGDRPLLGEALSWRSRTSWLLGNWADALRTAESAVEVLGGLGETREYARALARRSQIAMLRDTDDAIDLSREALSVAQRVGDGPAEVNARVNLYTALSNLGTAAAADEMRACVALAIEVGAPDEAYRALVNWLWQAHTHTPLPEVMEETRRALVTLDGVPAIETFELYVALSIARLLALPLGDWNLVDETLARPPRPAASTSLVRRDLEAGMAVRRGDLAAADEVLPAFRRDALASGEPQRIAPMLAVAFARAAVAGDLAELRDLTDILLDFGPRVWVPTFASPTIPRALAVADEELLRRIARELEALPPERRRWRAAVAAEVASAHVALADGDDEEAVVRLEAVVRGELDLARPYDAACVELDLARALDAAGRSSDGDAVRARARAYLERLGCVNPY